MILCIKTNAIFRYGPSSLWAEFVWDDLVTVRVCNGPSLLWAEMSSYRFNEVRRDLELSRIAMLLFMVILVIYRNKNR